MSRTIVIGDIHGCFDELCDLLEVIDLQTDDRIIAVGDLITKGPKNAQVLDLFISDQRFSSVVGNHDRTIRQRLRGEPVPLTKQQREAIQQLDEDRERYSSACPRVIPTMAAGKKRSARRNCRSNDSERTISSPTITEKVGARADITFFLCMNNPRNSYDSVTPR